MNKFLKKFIDKNFKAAGKALDLGCGKFYDIKHLKSKGWKCDGADKINGQDLEKYFLSKKTPFDLVYSNFVLHFIKNKKTFIKTVYNNLKKNGKFFILAMHKTDKICDSDITIGSLKKLLISKNFKNIKMRLFADYDNDPGHKHWHRIIEASGKK